MTGWRGEGRNRSRAGRRKLVQELAGRLEQLDGELDLILERFGQRERGRLRSLIAAAAEEPGEASLPGRKTLQAMLELLDGLELKPERGRTRDLVAIHRLLKRLESLWEGD